MPNILIACECSQTIANEFRRNGFNAFSCDIENCYGGHPEYSNWCESITKNRSTVRSKTFQGVANAIVKQRGEILNA